MTLSIEIRQPKMDTGITVNNVVLNMIESVVKKILNGFLKENFKIGNTILKTVRKLPNGRKSGFHLKKEKEVTGTLRENGKKTIHSKFWLIQLLKELLLEGNLFRKIGAKFVMEATKSKLIIPIIEKSYRLFGYASIVIKNYNKRKRSA